MADPDRRLDAREVAEYVRDITSELAAMALAAGLAPTAAALTHARDMARLALREQIEAQR